MKLSDYVMSFLESLGISHVFFLPGGGAMHLNDSLGSAKGLVPVCMLHEQAAAIAAESYAKASGGYGACLVTTGPGGTNAVTGVAGAWLDSTPVIFLSGQVKREDLVGNQGLRQFGIQELNIIDIVRPITKLAVQIQNPKDIRYELERAAAVARAERPGPVWIDIPLDIQAMDVNPSALRGYDAQTGHTACASKDADAAYNLLKSAKRPVMLLGHGLRLSGAHERAVRLAETLNIPVLTTWNGVDLIQDDHPLFFGRPGTLGHRHANFIQQGADVFLSIGARLNLIATGFNYNGFLKNGKHIMVDIDPAELCKKNVSPALAIRCDAGAFTDALLARARGPLHTEAWLRKCRKLKDRYPLRIPEQDVREGVCTYDLIQEIAKCMTPADIFQFTSSGTTLDIAMQVFTVKKGQRTIVNKGLASMGFDVPACIGSCLGLHGRRVVCVTGDGGFAMNAQELATLARLRLPVKIFVVDNDGYSMIYTSQYNNFDRRLTGCTKESGLELPPVLALSSAYGLETFDIREPADLADGIAKALSYDGPCVCRVKGSIAQRILPRQTNVMGPDGQMMSRPLEDMSPSLPGEELAAVLAGLMDKDEPEAGIA